MQLSTFTYDGTSVVIQEGALGDGVGSKVGPGPLLACGLPVLCVQPLLHTSQYVVVAGLAHGFNK